MDRDTGVSDSRRRGRLFYGWRVVAATSLQGMIGNGIISHGFAVFFLPIQRALSIDRASMSLVFSLARAEGGVGAPLVGWLVDKFGSRPLILFGGLTSGIGLILLSQAQNYWQVILIHVGVISVGKSTSLSQSLMSTVNQWFIRHKSLAISTLMTSFAAGGAIVVPLLALGNANLGWRDTLLYSGFSLCLLTLPVALVVRSKPEDLGLLPDGDVVADSATVDRGEGRPGSPPIPNDFTVRQAFHTSAFWLILMGVITRVTATNGMIIHLIPILVWKDVDEQTAALYLSLMFFISIPLRFGLGTVSGYLSPRKILFVAMNLGAGGLLALLVLDGPAAVLIFILGLSVVEGIPPVNWIMMGDYFGRSRFASLLGAISLFTLIGLLSPVYTGWVFDRTGSYSLVLVTFFPLYLASSILFALARKPTLPKAPVQPPVRAGIAG